MSNQLLTKLDSVAKERDYSSRSEVIRDAVRQYLSNYELSTFTRGLITATITVILEHKTKVDEKIIRLRHEYDKIVTGNMHLHLGENHCLEVFISKGEVEDVMNFIGKIRAIKYVQQVRFTITPIEQ